MESIKTAYATAYDRLLLLIKSGKIGQVVSIDSVCTSLREKAPTLEERNHVWSGFEAWMPTALLPIYQLLGTTDCTEQFVSSFYDQQQHYDRFTQMNLIYPNAVATARVGMGVKAEGNSLSQEQKAMYMFLLLGGKQIILKLDLKIKRTISGIFTNWKVKASATK